MTIVNSFVTYADMLTDDGTDYGTGYYMTVCYNDGGRDFFGPYTYEEDAKSNNNVLYWTMEFQFDDQDLFEALGIKEEWEEDELSDQYAEQDARTLKEYGFWSSTRTILSLCPSLSWRILPLVGTKYSYRI